MNRTRLRSIGRLVTNDLGCRLPDPESQKSIVTFAKSFATFPREYSNGLALACGTGSGSNREGPEEMRNFIRRVRGKIDEGRMGSSTSVVLVH
jgi:hypothetical protein